MGKIVRWNGAGFTAWVSLLSACVALALVASVVLGTNASCERADPTVVEAPAVDTGAVVLEQMMPTSPRVSDMTQAQLATFMAQWCAPALASVDVTTPEEARALADCLEQCMP